MFVHLLWIKPSENCINVECNVIKKLSNLNICHNIELIGLLYELEL